MAGSTQMTSAKGYAPLVRFNGKNETLLFAGTAPSRAGVKRHMWFFNQRSQGAEVLDVLPITMIAHTWPEPCREALPKGTRFWLVDLLERQPFWSEVWVGDASDLLRLERGLVHLTLEAAQAHAEALLSLSK